MQSIIRNMIRENNMYLKKLIVKNFRIFDESGIELIFNKGINAIIGENNSGKSSVIDALRIVYSTVTYKKDIFFSKSDFHVSEDGTVANHAQFDVYLEDVPRRMIEIWNPQSDSGTGGDFHIRFEKYISNLNPIKLTLTAHIKNENAELWSINDINAKIVDCMANKTKFIFRMGKSIYEDCIFASYKPQIASIYDLNFIAEIHLNYGSISQSYKSDSARIMNVKPPVGDFERQNYNLAAKEVYKGIIT